MTKIDKGILMPPEGGKTFKYPWREMEIGDSFLFDKKVSVKGASVQAFTRGAKYKRKYAVRTVGKRVRCWRIK